MDTSKQGNYSLNCFNVLIFLCPVPELSDLVDELQEVNDWITLGLYLGIKMCKLEEIELDYQKLGRCRTQMLEEWLKNTTPTWSALVQALVGIGNRCLAYMLAQKHGWLKLNSDSYCNCFVENWEYLLVVCVSIKVCIVDYFITINTRLSTQELLLPSYQLLILCVSWKVFFSKKRR